MINLDGLNQFFKYVTNNVNFLDRTTPSELFKKFGLVDILKQILPYLKYLPLLETVESQKIKINDLEERIKSLELKISTPTQG